MFIPNIIPYFEAATLAFKDGRDSEVEKGPAISNSVWLKTKFVFKMSTGYYEIFQTIVSLHLLYQFIICLEAAWSKCYRVFSAAKPATPCKYCSFRGKSSSSQLQCSDFLSSQLYKILVLHWHLESSQAQPLEIFNVILVLHTFLFASLSLPSTEYNGKNHETLRYRSETLDELQTFIILSAKNC